MTLKLNFTGSTDVGLIASTNKDAYYIDPEGRFFIVADGNGGYEGGDVVSGIATQKIPAYLSEKWQSSRDSDKLLEFAFLTANEAILQEQQDNPELADMGTSVVVVIFRSRESPICANVGNCRLYRWRESQLEQITEDHTWVAKAIKAGDITPEEARVHSFRHLVLSCLGREEIASLKIQPVDLKVGDRLLLCSDGLTEELTDRNIADYLQQASTLEEAASSLIEAAKEKGGKDNITVVLVDLL